MGHDPRGRERARFLKKFLRLRLCSAVGAKLAGHWEMMIFDPRDRLQRLVERSPDLDHGEFGEVFLLGLPEAAATDFDHQS